MQINHYLPRPLPDMLQDLATLALDLRWSWNHGADDLWYSVDPDLWTETGNPWLILETVSHQRLAELAGDKTFLEALRQQAAARDEHFQTET